MMTKKDFYKAAEILGTGGDLTYKQQVDLLELIVSLFELMEEAESDNGDVFGTEGLEHAIGWD